MERRRETGSAALREATREAWMKQKRRLGLIGRDKKGKLMPQWESVKRFPLHRIRHQLARWTRVSFRTVLRGGQQTLNGHVTRARGVAKRPVHDDDDGAVAATHKQRRANPPEQPQRQPALHDALKRELRLQPPRLLLRLPTAQRRRRRQHRSPLARSAGSTCRRRRPTDRRRARASRSAPHDRRLWRLPQHGGKDGTRVVQHRTRAVGVQPLSPSDDAPLLRRLLRALRDS